MDTADCREGARPKMQVGASAIIVISTKSRMVKAMM